MTELRPGQGSDQFNVRFPPGMRDRIKVAADQKGRSMNAEIIATLEERYPAKSVDVRAVDGLLHYIAAASSEQAFAMRILEVNEKFIAMGSPLRVVAAENRELTIRTDF